MNVSLLEYLAYRTQCDYLSDLRYKSKSELLLVIRSIDMSNCSLSELNDVVHYICGIDTFFNSQILCIDALMNYLLN